MKIGREEIKKMVPHREPMLLVDETEVIDGWEYSSYHFTGDEFFFKGHYPGHPVVPGVILCEIMGQSSSLLVNQNDYLVDKTPFYAGIERARFKHQVRPGDTLTVKSHIVESRPPLFVIEAKGFVGETLCCSGRLTFMVVENKDLK